MKLAKRLMMKQASGGDPYWDNVELLIQPPESGSTITDATGKTVTVLGNTAVSNAMGYPTIYFDGNGDWLQIPYDPVFDLASGDFTLDICGIAPSQTVRVVGHRNQSSRGWMVRFTRSSNRVEFSQWTAAAAYNEAYVSALPAAGQLYFVCITRAGNVVTVACNGTLGTVLNTANRPGSQTDDLVIGRENPVSTSDQMLGHVTGIRLTIGVARDAQEISSAPFPIF